MQKAVKFLLGLGFKWQSWLGVVAICVVLVATAVYRQQFLYEYPCELCIYTRVWLTFMAITAIVGLLCRSNIWLLRAVLILEIALSLGLAHVVWQLLSIEYHWDSGGGACASVANFPSWARLDEWFPLLYKVQGSCGPTPYVLFKISMAQGLAAVAFGFLVAFACGLIGSFNKKAKVRQ